MPKKYQAAAARKIKGPGYPYTKDNPKPTPTPSTSSYTTKSEHDKAVKQGMKNRASGKTGPQLISDYLTQNPPGKSKPQPYKPAKEQSTSRGSGSKTKHTRGL